MSKRFGIGIIGCGVIAGPYVKDLRNYEELELIGVADLDPERARQFATEHETYAFPDAGALLADPRVEIVLNLTIHHAHKLVSEQCLLAGKHVFSEKPLSMTYADASGLVSLAQLKGLRLGCAPFTLMGEAQQTTWKLIREGRIGEVRVAYAEVNWGRIESWHPAPKPFYDVGPLFDVGVYPLTILVAMFGPALRLRSYGKVVYPNRQTRDGQPFTVETPDFSVTMMEMASGLVVRLTTDFYVPNQKQTGIEFHGDTGSIHLKSWHDFDSMVEYAPFGEAYTEVPLLREGHRGTPWGRGVWDMACAIRDDRPHRFTGAMAAHVVEILETAQKSMHSEGPLSLKSSFEQPAPLDWAL